VNDVERWIYLDGPEPERIAPYLDALRDLPPATLEDEEEAVRRVCGTIDAELALLMDQHQLVDPLMEEEAAAPDAPPAPVARPPSVRLAEAAAPDAPRAPLPRPPSVRPAEAAPGPRPQFVRLAEAAATLQSRLDQYPAMSDALHHAMLPPAPPAHLAPPPPAHLAPPPPAHLAPPPLAPPPPAHLAPPGWRAAGAVPFPDLTLEQYASFRAELEIEPERTAGILCAYRVPDEAAGHALVAHWDQRFAAQPGVYATYAGLVARFSVWLFARRPARTPATPAAAYARRP
jgi:hypothetical protein